MRYDDWDILLFPRDGKVPLKEFKVACHVIQDTEFSHLHGSFGLPTVCCFVPSLAPGAPYKLSIHSWSTPLISQTTRTYGKFADRVVFEVRLFVDGRLVSSSSMNRAGPWPNVLKSSFAVSNTGELQSLKFPEFQRDLLNHDFWSPADELGRIKVVISESYPRESLTTPFERLKNIVAFSFQHAPLDILEGSAIAWPNSSMWRNMPFTASASLPTRQANMDRSHAHSPRPRNASAHATLSLTETISSLGHPEAAKHGEQSKASAYPYLDLLPSSNTVASDPFVEANAYFEWLNGIGLGLNGSNSSLNPPDADRSVRKSNTDTSMPDYTSSNEASLLPGDGQNAFAAKVSSDTDATHMKVPSNTPTTGNPSTTEPESLHFTIVPSNTPLSTALVDSGDNSFFSQSTTLSPQLIPTPAMQVKSRKENKAKQLATSPSVSATISISGEPVSVRKVSQQLFKPGGLVVKASPGESPSRHSSAERSGKRVRNFTPTSAKAFEDDEEPRRASPRVRLNAFDETPSKG